MANSSAWSPTSHWIGTCSRRSCEKSCKASPAARAGTMDADGVCTERTPRGGADEDYAQDSGISEPPASAGRTAHAAARAGGEPGALRLSQTDGDPEERRLAGQSQADLSAVYRRWTDRADETTQEAGTAIAGGDAQGSAAQSEVEH